MKGIKKQIYELLQKVPKGKVVTYGQIANEVPNCSAQLVGFMLHQNTDSEKYPCHRVVFADGNLTKSYVFGGEGEQRGKLIQEGVLFKGAKIDMDKSRFYFA
jgi:methylated-DNA-protein-cysteine methyltransferase-like protein